MLKGELPPRPALDAYLIDRYREFVSGLLDVTDNIVNGEVVHPPEVVRHDDDDPYLVVAADKGTAHLSDTANQVSAQYGFWLGDAFASGGSNGYDHKKEGITARGAWECVQPPLPQARRRRADAAVHHGGHRRHVGDVFGNGAAAQPATKLVAAFNHCTSSSTRRPIRESELRRARALFALPRSSWKDYDASLISHGGGIFERSAKAIPLSAEARALLGIEANRAERRGSDPRASCRAKVDLLYNGGIGTYIKASTEDERGGRRPRQRSRARRRDGRARAGHRRGRQPRADAARAARSTGCAAASSTPTRSTTPAASTCRTTRSTSRSCSTSCCAKGADREPRAERNKILAEMTDEVSELVLEDNRHQALALTLDGLRSAARYEDYVTFVDELTAAGVVNRADDAMPPREELLASPAPRSGPAAPAARGADGAREELGVRQRRSRRRSSTTSRAVRSSMRTFPSACAPASASISSSIRCGGRSSRPRRSTTSSTKPASGCSPSSWPRRARTSAR